MVEKAQKEVENMIREEGEAATLEVGVHGIHPELVRLLGKMKFRTSYGQNVLKHSIEVSLLCGLLHQRLDLMSELLREQVFYMILVNQSIMRWKDPMFRLVLICAENTRNQNLSSMRLKLIMEILNRSLFIACIVQAADAISAARPGARRETLETYTNRLKQLEDITNGFDGVEKSYAIQAGSEIRIMVVPEVISDADMVLLARDISKKIEDELEYP